MHQMSEWSEHVALFPVITEEGLRLNGPLMRRRDPETGKWRYRKMAPAEQADYVSRDAW